MEQQLLNKNYNDSILLCITYLYLSLTSVQKKKNNS